MDTGTCRKHNQFLCDTIAVYQVNTHLRFDGLNVHLTGDSDKPTEELVKEEPVKKSEKRPKSPLKLCDGGKNLW